MKFEDIVPGMLVTLTDSPDAKIYFVRDKDTPEHGVNVDLSYWLLDGSVASVTPVHYSLPLKPTRSQLEHRIAELDAWYDKHQEFDDASPQAPVWKEYVAMGKELHNKH